MTSRMLMKNISPDQGTPADEMQRLHLLEMLNDCLVMLDAFDAPVAAAHLSACLESFKTDCSQSGSI